MKFIINREDLIKPLTTVCGIVSRSAHQPILHNVLLASQGSILDLSTADLQMEMASSAAADITTYGAITVEALKLLEICRKLPSHTKITFSQEGESLHLRAGISRFKLATLPADQFPSVRELGQTSILRLTEKAFKDLLSRAAFSMAKKDARNYLNGILLESDNGTLNAVATDGHRLAICSLAINTPAAKAIIPRKAVLEMLRLLSDKNDSVTLMVGNRQLAVKFRDIFLSTTLIDGTFPDYTKVIPKACTSRLVINRERLKQSLMRVDVLSDKQYRGVRLGLAKNVLLVSSANNKQELAEDKIEADYRGEPFEIGFNNGYLIEALNAIESEEVEFGFNGPANGCLLTRKEDLAARYVVMPMRV
jgi:DNA polymerase-3 subunit beta